MKQRLALLALVVLLTLSLSACGVVDELKSVNAVGDQFMTALRDGDAEASWNLVASNIQEEIGSYEAWQSFAGIRNFESWTFSSTSIENNQATLEGEATLGAETYTVTFIMEKSGDSWKIIGIDFTFKE